MILNLLSRLRILILLATATATSVNSVVAEETPQFVRIAVVDCSGSMEGERIENVRGVLLNLIRQLPPSATHPVVLIRFGTTAAPPVTFVDLPTFEATAAKLSADLGGTDIAAGLKQAVQQVEHYRSSKDMWVLLFSDGEDSNQTGIEQVEESLDAIFADRQKQSLRQTVFCQRWGREEAHVLHQIQSRGHAKVIDAGQLNIKSVTFYPQVKAQDIAWDLNDPRQLNVTYTVQIDIQGDLAGLTIPPIVVQYESENAKGDLKSNVIPGMGGTTIQRLSRQVTADERKAGKIVLPFTFTPPEDPAVGSGLTLAQFATTSVEVPIKLPENEYRFRVTAKFKPSEGTWCDMTLKRARYPVKLTLDVSCIDGVGGTPGDVEFIPQLGTHVASGPKVVKLPGSGTVEVDYIVEAGVENPDHKRSQWRCPIEFEGRPVNTPPRMTFEPPIWKIATVVPAPHPMQTLITGRVSKVSAAEWTNLALGLAKFEVETEFDVHGPIGKDTVLKLITTGSVIDLKSKPAVLRTGLQRIQLSLIAQLKPKPQTEPFVSTIVAPATDGVIDYKVGSPLMYSAIGPSAIPLSLRHAGRSVVELRASLADNGKFVRMIFEPIAVGHKNSPLIGALKVQLVSKVTGLTFPTSEMYRAYHAYKLNVPVTLPSGRSFFRDVALSGTIELKPPKDNAAVTPATIPVRVIIAAPFKRLALYLAVSLSVLVTGVVLTRMFLALRRSH